MRISLRKSILAAAVALLPVLAWAQDAYEGTHFVMHASGLHLAKSQASAVYEAADKANPQAMTIAKNSEGYYTIAAPDGTFLAKGGSNEWNTMFINSAGSKDAHFSFESDGQFLLIKNRTTGKYLGTDDVADGAWVFCDKDGKSTMHKWFLADEPDAEAPTNNYKVIINPAAERQAFEGFGVSLCWWANMCGNWSDEKIDEIIEWLVSPEYLNYNVFRYNIGGGDDPEHRNCDEHHMAAEGGKGLRAEMPGFKAYEDSEYDWDADAAQIKIMLKIKEKRPDAIFEAFSNSAPWWMTNSGCCAGANSSSQDNLKVTYYDAFAHYLVDVCVHMKETYGIEFRTLEPFNEPMTNYWGRNGGQEGCHFHVASMIAFLKVLQPILAESGLKTVISASDETDIAQAVKDFDAFKNADVLKYIGQWNTHSYSGDNKARAQTAAQCADNGMRLWMSEVGGSGNGFEGNLAVAQKLINDMRYIQPNAWVDWQYIEEGNDQWCLVQAGFKSQNYRRVNNFYVRQHFSKYIKPGYTILTSTNDMTLSAISPDGDELVIVALNPSALESKYNVDLSLFKSVGTPTTAAISAANSYFNDIDYTIGEDNHLSFKIPGLNIVTFVIPVEKKEGFDASIKDGEEYLLMPRNSSDLAVTARNNNVQLAALTMADDQVWKLAVADGKATFTNRAGDIITATSDYMLSYGKQATGVQAFTITPIGAGYNKIEATIDGTLKAFDLQSEGSSAGTNVGMWDYGTAPTAIHRQFALLHLTEPSTSAIRDIMADSAASERAAIITTGHGYVSVMPLDSEAEAQVTICTLDGRTVYAGSAQGSVQVPLRSGAYLVACASGSARTAQVVRVK